MSRKYQLKTTYDLKAITTLIFRGVNESDLYIGYLLRIFTDSEIKLNIFLDIHG